MDHLRWLRNRVQMRSPLTFGGPHFPHSNTPLLSPYACAGAKLAKQNHENSRSARSVGCISRQGSTQRLQTCSYAHRRQPVRARAPLCLGLGCSSGLAVRVGATTRVRCSVLHPPLALLPLRLRLRRHFASPHRFSNLADVFGHNPGGAADEAHSKDERQEESGQHRRHKGRVHALTHNQHRASARVCGDNNTRRSQTSLRDSDVSPLSAACIIQLTRQNAVYSVEKWPRSRSLQ